jgi:tetratricopeptide (TPR) repeat protein
MMNKVIPALFLILIAATLCQGFDVPSPKRETALAIMTEIAACNFEQARTSVDSLISTDSSDPLGWMLLLSTIALQQLDYNQSDGAEIFQGAYEMAEAKMEAYEKQSGTDSYVLTIRGISQIIATAYTMHRKKYWAAIGKGFDALDMCKEAVKIDSSNVDAAFVLGLYNYARAELKRKFLGILFWYSGDKRSGIRVIEQCSRNARLIPMVADMVLQEIYVREGMFDKASSGIERLLAAYPGNRFIWWTKAKLMDVQKIPDQAAHAYGVLADAYEQIPKAKKNFFMTRTMEVKRYCDAHKYDKAIEANESLLRTCKRIGDDCCDEAEALSKKLRQEPNP